MYIYFGSLEPIWQFASLRIQFFYTERQIFSRVGSALENAFGNISLLLSFSLNVRKKQEIDFQIYSFPPFLSPTQKHIYMYTHVYGGIYSYMFICVPVCK